MQNKIISAVKYRKILNVPSNFLIQIKLQEFIETKNRTVALAGV